MEKRLEDLGKEAQVKAIESIGSGYFFNANDALFIFFRELVDNKFPNEFRLFIDSPEYIEVKEKFLPEVEKKAEATYLESEKRQDWFPYQDNYTGLVG